MSKLAAFQFYPGDWLKDPALSICTAGARGVWIDVLCLMFESPRRGCLITNGRPWTLPEIAEALRGRPKANLSFLKELVRNGVMKYDKKKGFFSSRLVRDEHQRETWRSEKRRQAVKNKGSDSGHHSGLVPADLHSSSSSSNLRSPLPPTSGGIPTHDDLLKDENNYSYMGWNPGHIIIKTGRHKRVLTQNDIQGLVGARIEQVVDLIRRKGFWAEIYVPTKEGTVPT
jgi:hypothetical protein